MERCTVRWSDVQTGGSVNKKSWYASGMVITFKCSSAPPPHPQHFRKRNEKVIMFPLEMTRSLCAPFIAKWNNFSTAGFFFFSLQHHHLSFQYTTPAPLFIIYFFHLTLKSIFSSFLLLVFGVEGNQCGVGACIILGALDAVPLQRSYCYYVKQVLGECT